MVATANQNHGGDSNNRLLVFSELDDSRLTCPVKPEAELHLVAFLGH